jgi:hypothetical protein
MRSSIAKSNFSFAFHFLLRSHPCLPPADASYARCASHILNGTHRCESWNDTTQDIWVQHRFRIS